MYSSVQNRLAAASLTGAVLALVSIPGSAAEWSGNVEAQWRVFTESAQNSTQPNSNLSVSGETEFYHELGDGDNTVLVTPFVRVDENDEERTHADLREAAWFAYADEFELRVGISKVFWGVTADPDVIDDLPGFMKLLDKSIANVGKAAGLDKPTKVK